jgi:hypothetical protein
MHDRSISGIIKQAHNFPHGPSRRTRNVGADVYPWPPSPMVHLDAQMDAITIGLSPGHFLGRRGKPRARKSARSRLSPSLFPLSPESTIPPHHTHTKRLEAFDGAFSYFASKGDREDAGVGGFGIVAMGKNEIQITAAFGPIDIASGGVGL